MPVSQARSVQASASQTGHFDTTPVDASSYDSKMAAGFAPFDALASAAVTYASAGANQKSQIAPLAVSASRGVGAFSLTPHEMGHGGAVGVATGSSNFSFTFDVAVPTPVSLDAMLSRSHQQGGAAIDRADRPPS